jgi:antitoxin ParD1/3/4
MHINLSPEMEQYIKSKVGSGFYGNATEVIRDAIRRMQASERHDAALMAAVAIGDAQLDRGEGDYYTPSLLERLTHKALHDPPDGKPADPDVLP